MVNIINLTIRISFRKQELIEQSLRLMKACFIKEENVIMICTPKDFQTIQRVDVSDRKMTFIASIRGEIMQALPT